MGHALGIVSYKQRKINIPARLRSRWGSACCCERITNALRQSICEDGPGLSSAKLRPNPDVFLSIVRSSKAVVVENHHNRDWCFRAIGRDVFRRSTILYNPDLKPRLVDLDHLPPRLFAW